MGSLSAASEAAKQKFAMLGKEISFAVKERQSLHVSLEKVESDVAKLEYEIMTDLPPLQESLSAFLEPSGLTAFNEVNLIKEKMAAFNNSVENVLCQFKKAPIGPLYSVLSVKNAKWSGLVEKILEPHLFTYIVDNVDDQILLESIAADCFPNFFDDLDESLPKVHVMVIDFHSKYLDKGHLNYNFQSFQYNYVNIMDMLKIKQKEMDIWKVFIGKELNTENIFLFKTEHDAFLLMHADSNTSFPVQQVKTAYSLDGFQIFPFPKFKTVTFKIPTKPLFMKVDRSAELLLLKAVQLGQAEEMESLNNTIENLRGLQISALNEFENVKQKMINEETDSTDL